MTPTIPSVEADLRRGHRDRRARASGPPSSTEACGGDAELRRAGRAAAATPTTRPAASSRPRAAPPTRRRRRRPPSPKRPARSSARTSCCSRSAKAAWASSSWPSRRSRSAARSRSRSSSRAWTRRQVIARFEAERQALALMDHPNIARVLDAGTTESGRPYFVMELVRGVPITEYCDDNQLTPRERLELFVPVCQAIQHAHQKGIIHRDIKPSNVLVTLYDGKPVPKVIDFGVAKATEQKLTERTLFTQFGTMVGTLEYMSPEQAEMSGLDVDTRSDIYSLGVLLYELLTGTTPLEPEAAAARRRSTRCCGMIREEEPPKPSTRLSDSGEALASIAAQRHTEPAKLTKLVRGELDWIVMKALEKDRNRRYETANGFAADVQRYLDDEPVQARSITMRQRMWRWYRRHVPLIAGAYTIFTFLICAVEFIAMYSIIPFLVRSPNASEILSGFGLMAITLLLCLEGVEMGIAAFRGKRRGLWMSLVAFLALCLTQCWWLSWSIGISREISADPVYSVTSLSLDTLEGRNVYIRNCVIGFNVLGIAWFFVGLVLQVHALCSRAADRNPDAWRGI